MSEPQTTRHLFMIEPTGFYFNPSTAPSNPYQQNNYEDRSLILAKAVQEFRAYVNMLVENGVHVTVAQGIPECPDQIFPNWFSVHEGRKLILYPMLTPNRAAEKTIDIINTLKRHYDVAFDWSNYEAEGKCLEGVSSLILDRPRKKAYGTFSVRTDKSLANLWCMEMGYEPFFFETSSHTGDPIYHSDVMMHLGTEYVGICSKSILPDYRDRIVNELSKDREVIDLTMDQVRAYAGNALEVKGENDKPMLIMSKSGYESLNETQRQTYLKYIDRFITPDLETVQYYGGGAARCMLQELF
jgi:hypothetical protein